MSYMVDVLIIILLFAVFGCSHSLLAGNKVKDFFIKLLGEYFAFYRLLYNIFSILSIVLLYAAAPKPDLVLYELSFPWDFIVLVPQLAGLFGFIYTLKFFNSKEFLGIEQVLRFIRGEYRVEQRDEILSLRIEGPYRASRHPLYFFAIIFLAFRPVMDLFYFTSFICITVYFYVGSIFEEKKMILVFGEVYEEYIKNVPKIFPYKFFKPYQI